MYAIKKVRRAVYATEKLSRSYVASRELLLTCVPLLADGDLTEVQNDPNALLLSGCCD